MASNKIHRDRQNLLSGRRYGLYESHHWESLRANASKAFYQDQEPDPATLGADASRSLRGNTASAPLKRGFSYWKGKAQDKAARLSYYYYNWRYAVSDKLIKTFCF